MKNIISSVLILIIILMASCGIPTDGYSQEKFNKVIDTGHESMNILVSTTPIGNGYILVVGSEDVDGFGDNRCSMVLKTDLEGNVLHRNFVCDSVADVYEGWYNQEAIVLSDNKYRYVFSKKSKCAYICDFDANLVLIDTTSIYFSASNPNAIANIAGFSYIDDYLYIIEDVKIDTLGSGFYHPILFKVDSCNNLVDEKYMYIGNANHQYYNIIKSNDGNLVVYGDLESSWLWLVSQVDEDGNLIWYKTYGRTGWNNGMYKFIAPSPDSSYVMSGMYPVCSGNSAQCVRKIDDSGNLLWEKVIKNYACYPAMIMENAYDVYVDEDGYIYMIGTGSTHNYLYTGFLLKLSPRGDIMYRRDYLPMGIVTRFENYLTSIKPTPDGGFILGGYTYDDYFGELFNDYYQQPWLVKTDHDGLDGLCYTELPELTLDVFIPDTVCNMDTIDCVVNISGPSAPYTLEFGTGQVIDSIYYPDIFVPITFGIDTILSGENMYNYTEPIVEATLKDSTSDFIIARHYNIRTPRDHGEQQLAITLTDFYGNTKTIYKDIYVNPCHEVEVDENENVVLSVYPNPARENIIVEGENIASIQICNLLGEVVYETQQCNGNNVISTDGMGAGSYFVRITMEDGKVVTKKIVVVKG